MKTSSEHIHTAADIHWQKIGQTLCRKMALVAFFGNFIGVCTVTSYFVFFEDTTGINQLSSIIAPALGIFAVLITVGITIGRKWEKDLHHFLRCMETGTPPDEALLNRARRTVLNHPMVSCIISLVNWGVAAVLMSAYRLSLPDTDISSFHSFAPVLKMFIGMLVAGIVTSAIVLFLSENVYRQYLPEFFPNGGMASIEGAIRFGLRSRVLVTFAISSLLPMVLMAVLSYNKARMMLVTEPEAVIESLFYMISFLMVITVFLIIIFSRMITSSVVGPVSEMEKAMDRVETGDLTAVVQPAGNDELGILADRFNRMTEGLRERYRMKQSMTLAMEVQQSLIPAADPKVEGIDVSGRCIYCDETGGDYYDYIDFDGSRKDSIGIVVGDVSDHGLPSALLMTSARAYLRQRSSEPGTLTEIVESVNRKIARDVGDTGRFITLFFCRIDAKASLLEWVRAGHDPAIVYSPSTDSFEELGGVGLPLGITEDTPFDETERTMKQDEIVAIATDGVWECTDGAGRQFGKDTLKNLIREHAHRKASEIVEKVMEAVSNHRTPMEMEDDITLIIAKME